MNEKLIKDFINAVKSEKKKPSPYDTSAKVVRVDGDTAWVHIAGGIDATPVKMTTSAKVGDEVQVRVSGGRAFIIGNVTSPPTDDTQANKATKKAEDAQEKASSAIDYAEIAKTASDEARTYAAEAKETTDEINAYAESAQKTVTQILNDGETAGVAAQEATESANMAQNSANQAITQLSIVENVVGVLELISKNGNYQKTNDLEPVDGKWYFLKISDNPPEYQAQTNVTFEYVLTTDTSIVPDKPYYTRSGAGTEQDPYSYNQVETPVASELSTYYENTNWNYYVLVGIDQAIENYVSSHLVLSGNSLLLKNGNTTVELSTTDGMILYNESGNAVARYGADTVIGDIVGNGFGIKIGESPESTPQERLYELGFYQGGNRVAYINNNSLYITQTVVLRQMKMGDNLGVWAWCVHTIGNRNNLYLKWLG